jgi:aldose 1-epimerase
MIRASSKPFGSLPDGSEVTVWTLRNRNGMEVEVLNYGAIIRRISVPTPGGKLLDVVLGYDDLAGYLQDRAWIGAVAGRVAGRITHGRLLINGAVHQLPINDPPNHLHGGSDSFHRKLWRGEVTADGSAVRLVYLSPHGEQGYPGDVIVAITYALTDDNELVFTTEAESLDVTPVSITQHSYFNLAGEGRGDIRDHMLTILADTIVPTAGDHTLSDRKVPVAGTPSDLRRPVPVGNIVPHVANQHLDLYWFGNSGETKHMARLSCPASGIVMDVHSTLDCLQAYSAVDFDGSGHSGKSGSPHRAYAGLALEVEGYPNACNVEGFGSILTEPGNVRKHVTTYAFAFPIP